MKSTPTTTPRTAIDECHPSQHPNVKSDDRGISGPDFGVVDFELCLRVYRRLRQQGGSQSISLSMCERVQRGQANPQARKVRPIVYVRSRIEQVQKSNACVVRAPRLGLFTPLAPHNQRTNTCAPIPPSDHLNYLYCSTVFTDDDERVCGRRSAVRTHSVVCSPMRGLSICSHKEESYRPPPIHTRTHHTQTQQT